MMNNGLKLAVAAVVFGMFLSGAVFTVLAQKMTKEEQDRALKQKKQQQQEQANRHAPTQEDIPKYEQLLNQCATGGMRNGDRCADIIFTLGVLYSEQGQKDKSLKMYWQLAREYPLFPKMPEAYYQMSQNYIEVGHIDTARIILEQLALRFPNSPHGYYAQFQLGELAYIDNNFNKAYKHFRAYLNACDKNKYEKCAFREEASKKMLQAEKAAQTE